MANEFETLRKQFREEDLIRETIIKSSRDVLKGSKQAIYSLHRGERKQAGEQLKLAEAAAKKLLPLVQKYGYLRGGAFSDAMEEFVEARAFLVFLTDNSLVKLKDVPFVEPHEYLSGLCDFTGELGRHAVHAATARKKTEVVKVRDMIDAIFGELLQFDFRNSELRRKYDSVKYNLSKVEQLLYELETR